MDNKTPPIDIRFELKEFNNDTEFLQKLLDDFFEQMEKRISNMEKAVLANDYKIIKTEAHAIKGGAANLSASALSETALDIELFSKAEDMEKSTAGIKKIKNEFTKLKNYVADHKSLKF